MALMPFMVERRLGILIALRRGLMAAAINQLVQVFACSSRWCQLDCCVCAETSVFVCFLAPVDSVVGLQLLVDEASLLLLVECSRCLVRIQGR